MKTKTIYEADDGVTFDDADECREYEARGTVTRLWNLGVEDTNAALDGTNPRLCEAFERFGRRCAEARIARGGSKRKKAVAG